MERGNEPGLTFVSIGLGDMTMSAMHFRLGAILFAAPVLALAGYVAWLVVPVVVREVVPVLVRTVSGA